ncbi:MAG: ABC transporter permease subunit [Bacteroidota bacterium]
MLRLLLIEYFKLKNSRYFWILGVLFLIFLLSVPIASKAFLDLLEEENEMIGNIVSAGELPLFDFVDIWQNLTWVYKSFTLFLGFIMVISICNEFSYGTIKQNVIDGLSRRELLESKLVMIGALSLFYSLLVLIIGLIMGFLWSPVKDFPFIVKNIEFVGAYFLHLFAFQLFCLLLSLWIKRSGIVIALLTFYVYVVEPIFGAIISLKYEQEWLANLLPISAIGNIIPRPFDKYLMQEVQSYVGWDDLGILIGYIILMLFLADRTLTKRDLR